ncbi:MAG: HAD family hydrolase, partial [Oscillospiraceae bacterium]|nr:HAD family hydrolase [Oscillospiraceae bacterium]
TMNGVFLVDPQTGEKISSELIPERGIKAAKKFIIANGETPIVYAQVNGVERVSFMKKSHKAVQNFNDTRKGDPFRHACDSYDELFEGEIHYITFLNPESEIAAIDAVFSRGNGFSAVTYMDTYAKNLRFYEAWSAGVSKATAALKLKDLVGADKIIAFGDNLNDIPMFEVSDECYAVENAAAELKAAATGIIGSNEAMSVPVFIEKRTARVWDYTPPGGDLPDAVRFAAAVGAAIGSPQIIDERAMRAPTIGSPQIIDGLALRAPTIGSPQIIGGRAMRAPTIGILNEKPVHAALKHYFSANPDHEAKIGSFIADAAGENGVYEIQTAGWDKLKKKLDVFLDVCHVTVVYPFEQRVHNAYIHERTGELLKKSPVRNNKDMSRFFLELYRIKGFLTHPNLTVCIAGLETEKLHFAKSAEKPRYRGQKRIKQPLSLLSETYLECGEDYRRFLPENLPEKFTRQEFIKLSKKCDGSILLEILEYMAVVRKCGKKGNGFVYDATPSCAKANLSW